MAQIDPGVSSAKFNFWHPMLRLHMCSEFNEIKACSYWYNPDTFYIHLTSDCVHRRRGERKIGSESEWLLFPYNAFHHAVTGQSPFSYCV